MDIVPSKEPRLEIFVGEIEIGIGIGIGLIGLEIFVGEIVLVLGIGLGRAGVIWTGPWRYLALK